MLATFATLILLVQHISTMLQAPNIAAAARQLLLRQVSLIQAESQAGNLIEQDRQAIQQSGQALQTKLECEDL